MEGRTTLNQSFAQLIHLSKRHIEMNELYDHCFIVELILEEKKTCLWRGVNGKHFFVVE